MPRWRLTDAQKRLPEVVEKALTEGPQTITVARGRSVVVSSRSLAKPRPKRRSSRTPTVIQALLAAPHVPEFHIPRQSEFPEPPPFN
jgi:antitoxin Phd